MPRGNVRRRGVLLICFAVLLLPARENADGIVVRLPPIVRATSLGLLTGL
jgi:hypothetical protein